MVPSKTSNGRRSPVSFVEAGSSCSSKTILAMTNLHGAERKFHPSIDVWLSVQYTALRDDHTIVVYSNESALHGVLYQDERWKVVVRLSWLLTISNT